MNAKKIIKFIIALIMVILCGLFFLVLFSEIDSESFYAVILSLIGFSVFYLSGRYILSIFKQKFAGGEDTESKKPVKDASSNNKQKKRSSHQVLRYILVIVLMISLISLLYSRLHIQHKRFLSEIESTNIELNKYHKINKEIAGTKKILESLKKKMDVIHVLETHRYESARLLKTLTQLIIPKQLYLTNLEIDKKEVRLKGIATDPKIVADFILRLENHELFNSVKLNSVQKKMLKDHIELDSFSITCIKVSQDKPARASPKKKT